MINTIKTGQQYPEPFVMTAANYHELGLSIMPCMGDDGKKPLTSWKALQYAQVNIETLAEWRER